MGIKVASCKGSPPAGAVAARLDCWVVSVKFWKSSLALRGPRGLALSPAPSPSFLGADCL